MKKLSVIIILMSVLFFQANGQEQKKSTSPDQKSIVNKEYDEDGNLIAYDSTSIQQWSSDTSYNFLFDDNLIFGDGFPDLSNFFEGFGSFPNDSIFMHDFNFDLDSTMRQFYFNGPGNFPNNFAIPDMKNIQKQLEEQFKRFNFPDYKFQNNLTEKQFEELEKLREKQAKEMDELRKKWEKENKK